MPSAILLESARRAQRDPRGAFLSALLHALVIAGAIALTAGTGRGSEPEVAEVPLPLYPVPRPEPVEPSRRAPSPPTPVTLLPPDLVAPPLPTNIVAPPTDIPDGVPMPMDRPGEGDFVIGPATPGARTDGAGTAGSAPGAVLESHRVDVEVMPKPGNPVPRYPETLRAMRVEGTVVMEYVVGTNGRVERESIRMINTAHPMFEGAVRQALERSRFVPAEVAGAPVRQLVRQEFVFALE